MKIAMSCNKTKECCKCKKPIYTNEIRRNRNNGTSEHLQCEKDNKEQTTIKAKALQ